MPDNNEIVPSMKMSILHTISKQIYSSLYVKIKEAVSNSYDNNATDFIYFYDRDDRALSLFDNGTGITKSRLKEILEGIGYGDGRDDHSKNSYFGLGLFSVLELGGRVDIYSKTPCGEYNHYSFNSSEIFSKANAKKPISDLMNYIDIYEVSGIRSKSILSDEVVVNCLGQPQNQFTEIVISDIPLMNMAILADEDFMRNLEKILPLKFNLNHKFFDKIEDVDQKERIQSILSNDEYCKAISFYSGTYDMDLYPHERYLPQLKDGLTFGSANVRAGIHESKDFAYFFVTSYENIESDASDQDQENISGISGNINSEAGFWVRNKNFLVKPADYFQKSGTRKRILDAPLTTWIYGEIFHKDMTEFLVVTRDEYVWSHEKFNTFFEQVKSLIGPLNKELREAWRCASEITKEFYDPFADIGTSKSPFKRIDAKYEAEDQSSINEVLKKFSPPKGSVPKDIPSLLKEQELFTIVDNDDYLIHIDPSATEIVRRYDEGAGRPVIVYPGSVFNSKRETLFGTSYNVSFIYASPDDNLISIDTENKQININPFNRNALEYSLTKLDVLFAIEFAYEKSKDKHEMKNHLYLILGGDKKPMSKTSVMGLFEVFSDQLGVSRK